MSGFGFDPTSGAFSVDFGGGASTTKQSKMMRKGYEYRKRYDPTYAKRMFDQQMANFKKHGIHPLFGLGAGAGAGSLGVSQPAMVGVPDTKDRGSISSKGIRPEELRVAELQGDLLEEQIKSSEQSRMIQLENHRKDQGVDDNGGPAKPIPLYYEGTPQAVPLAPDKPGQIPGDHPSWKLHNLSFGNYEFKLWGPGNDVSEAFENVVMYPAIYAVNQDAIHKYLGQIIKDKSNIGRLFGFWKYAYEMMRFKK